MIYKHEEKIKTFHFGDSRYNNFIEYNKINSQLTNERKRLYLLRQKNDNYNNFMKASYWAKNVLWNLPTLEQSINSKLSHLIDRKLTNNIDNINNELIQYVIDDYDAISESQEFPYPSAIKKRLKKLYDTKLSLPSSLSVDIVEIECENECCVSVKV